MTFHLKRFNGNEILLPNDLKDILNKYCKLEINLKPSINEEITPYILGKLTESFRDLLFKYIDSSKKSDADIYKKAYIDRRHFSKIRSDENYHPSFKTVTLLSLALELSTKQYEELLNSAAYSLPNNKKEYIVIRYCFDNGIYDIQKINTYLFAACKKSLNNI